MVFALSVVTLNYPIRTGLLFQCKQKPTIVCEFYPWDFSAQCLLSHSTEKCSLTMFLLIAHDDMKHMGELRTELRDISHVLDGIHTDPNGTSSIGNPLVQYCCTVKSKYLKLNHGAHGTW